jgi:hypothetical protein
LVEAVEPLVILEERDGDRKGAVYGKYYVTILEEWKSWCTCDLKSLSIFYRK